MLGEEAGGYLTMALGLLLAQKGEANLVNISLALSCQSLSSLTATALAFSCLSLSSLTQTSQCKMLPNGANFRWTYSFPSPHFWGRYQAQRRRWVMKRKPRFEENCFFFMVVCSYWKNETILFLSDKRSLTTLLFFKMPCSHSGSISLCIMETSWWKRQNKREGWSTKYSSPPRESFMGGAEHSYYHKIFVTSHPQNRPKTSRAMLNLCHLWDFGERMPFVLYFQ